MEYILVYFANDFSAVQIGCCKTNHITDRTIRPSNSMEQSLSSEADSYSACQDILSPLDSLRLPQDRATGLYPEPD
jgi:hypothetical protein